MAKKNYLYLGIFLGLFLVVWFFTFSRLNTLDAYFVEHVPLWRVEGLTLFFKGITFFGSGTFIVIASILLSFLLKNKDRFLLWGLLVSHVILNHLFKVIITRPRPVIAIVDEPSYSFPSGHAMGSMIFYGILIYFLWLSSNCSKKVKLALNIFLGVLLFFIGVSRIYLGVHYVTDVFAGYLLGGFVCLCGVNFSQKGLQR